MLSDEAVKAMEREMDYLSSRSMTMQVPIVVLRLLVEEILEARELRTKDERQKTSD